MSYTESKPRTFKWQQELGVEGACASNGVTTSNRTVTWSDTKSGESNPNHRKQIALGQNASTDYTKSEKTFLMPRARVDVYYWDTQCSPKKRAHQWGLDDYAALAIPPTPNDLTSATADNRARSATYKSIQRQQQAFQSLVCIGELGETIRMLTGAARGLRRNLIRHVTTATKVVGRIKRRPRDTVEAWGKRRARVAADLHLQFVFGARPFFSDIGSANAWLERRLELVDPSLPVFGRGIDKTNVQTYVAGGAGYRRFRYCKHTNTEVDVRYYGRVSGRTLGNRALVEARLLGFNPANWLPTVYELTPWSFFLDYFSNLGDVVESWSMWQSGVKWMSSTTVKQRSVEVFYMGWNPINTGAPWYATGSLDPQGRHFAANKSITRERDRTLEPPSLEFRIPGSGTKWANIAALAVALSGGSRSLSRSLGRPEPKWMRVQGAANW